MQAVKTKEICVVCKEEKEILCQKRRMCKVCYRTWYQTEGKRRDVGHPIGQTYYQEKIFHHTEIEFIKNFFTHQNWIYQPANFRVNDSRYSPDFYDGERNIFIEVSGTYQAFYDNRDKYHEFIKAYPKINFEIRTAIGTLIPLNADAKGTYPVTQRNGKK